MQKIIPVLVVLFLLWGCAAHPTISPIPLEKDETRTAICFSYENLLPVFVYRKGLSGVSDFGIRIGIPIYGSGIDYSRTVFQRGNFYDIVNFAYSLSPNSSFDMTYYSVHRSSRKPDNARYSGFRAMYIPNGINENESIRVGALIGFMFRDRIGIEMGYFHDLDKGQPIEKLFSMEPEDSPRYPAITGFGFPSENSRLVGLSLQLSLNTTLFQKKK